MSGELKDHSFPGLQFIVEFLAKLVFIFHISNNQLLTLLYIPREVLLVEKLMIMLCILQCFDTGFLDNEKVIRPMKITCTTPLPKKGLLGTGLTGCNSGKMGWLHKT